MTMIERKNELLVIYSNMKSLEFAIGQSSDEAFNSKQQERLVELNDKKVLLERDINLLNTEINLLQESIENINKLCKKKYATDENVYNDVRQPWFIC